MVKNTIKFCIRFFRHKINQKMQRKAGVKCFPRSCVGRHLHRMEKLVTSQVGKN